MRAALYALVLLGPTLFALAARAYFWRKYRFVRPPSTR